MESEEFVARCVIVGTETTVPLVLALIKAQDLEMGRPLRDLLVVVVVVVVVLLASRLPYPFSPRTFP